MIALDSLRLLSDKSPSGPWQEFLQDVEQCGSGEVITWIAMGVGTKEERQEVAQFIAGCVNYVRQELEAMPAEQIYSKDPNIRDEDIANAVRDINSESMDRVWRLAAIYQAKREARENEDANSISQSNR